VPKCKRRLPAGVIVAVTASGVLAASAFAATIDGDDGPIGSGGLRRRT
jgi:hypothetical protein